MPSIIIASGLPRAGTSLLMQMLGAGGVPLLTDGFRKPDTNNPKGYYEFEPVKTLAANVGWLDQATGKAVKVVAPLVPFLPTGPSYRFLFIERDLGEILDSQARMLKSQIDEKTRDSLRDAFEQHLGAAKAWARNLANHGVLEISHRQLLMEPNRFSVEIREFLKDFDLDSAAMAACIDPDLHRNKSTRA